MVHSDTTDAEVPGAEHAGKSPLGARLPHESALRHVTGAARYVDDLPHPHGMLHAMMWCSPWAHATIDRIDKDRGRKLLEGFRVSDRESQ